MCNKYEYEFNPGVTRWNSSMLDTPIVLSWNDPNEFNMEQK